MKNKPPAELARNVQSINGSGSQANDEKQDDGNRLSAGMANQSSKDPARVSRRRMGRFAQVEQGVGKSKKAVKRSGNKESANHENQDENRVSEGQNRDSYSRDAHSRNRTSGEGYSRESYSRESYHQADKKAKQSKNAQGSEERTFFDAPKRRRGRTKRHTARKGAETGKTEESIGSDDSSIESERIEVIITSEFRDYVEKVTIGKLSRHSFTTTLRLGKLGFYCVMVSYVATMDNFAMFTFCFVRHGMMFLIPFTLCMFCLGFPMAYLELALGQYTHSSVLSIFDRIAPISVGVGVSSTILLMLSVLMGNDLIAMMFEMFLRSIDIFTTELPWDNCVGSNSRARRVCIHPLPQYLMKPSAWRILKISTLTTSSFILQVIYDAGLAWVVVALAALLKFGLRVLTEGLNNELRSVNLSDTMPLVHRTLAGHSDFYTLTITEWPSAGFLASTVIIFIAVAHLLAENRQGVIKTMSYLCVSIIFLGTFMVVIVFTHISPPPYPATQILGGIEFKQHGNLSPWIEAVVMACTILQLGYGGIIFLGSQSPFFNDLITDSMVITATTTFMFMSHAMVHALTRDSFILQMSQGNFDVFNRAQKNLNDYTLKANRASSKIYSIFMGSLEIFATLHAPLTVLLSLFGIICAVSSKFVRVEILFTIVMEFLGLVSNKDTRSTLLFIICLLLSFFTLFFSCPGCYLLQVSLTTNVMPMATIVVALCELFVIVVLYGTRRLFCNVATMIAGKAASNAPFGVIDYLLSLTTTILWIGLIPIVLIAALVLTIKEPASNFDGTDKLALFIILLPIPICAIYKIIYCYYHRMNFKRLFIPDGELWGPRATRHRTIAERNEKRLRV